MLSARSERSARLALAEALEEKARRAARRSLAAFVRRHWNLVEPSVPLRWTWHIDAICEHLEAVSDGRIRRLLVNVPPGHIKSILVGVMWPAWEWLEHPERRSLFSSYSLDLTIRDSVRCRELIDTPEYQELIPRDESGRPLWQRKGVPDLKDQFETTAAGFRQCVSTGSKGTGLRGHRVVTDDPLNVKESVSEGALAECIRWWDHTMSSRLVEPATGQRVIIMQRLHQRDLSGHVLHDLGGYDHLCLPSEYEGGGSCDCPPGTPCSQRNGTSIGFVDPRTVPGELLNPAYFPQVVISEAKRDLGAIEYAGQHGQRPSPKEGAVIKVAWTQNRWTVMPTAGDWRIYGDLRNAGKNPKSSFAVFQLWFRPSQYPARRYLVDQIRGRWDQVEEEKQLRNFCRKWPQAGAKKLENKADAPGVQAHLRDEIPGLVLVDVHGSKEDRGRSTVHLWEAGNVWLPSDAVAPWMPEFVQEVTTVPGAANDDQFDTMTLALNDNVQPATISKVSVPRRYGQVV